MSVWEGEKVVFLYVMKAALNVVLYKYTASDTALTSFPRIYLLDLYRSVLFLP